MFKKTAIAVAVAGAVSVPMAAQADGGPTVYGFVNIGISSLSIDNNPGGGDDGIGSNIFFGGEDGSTQAHDSANTRFGFKGSKDLGNGLTAGYKIEIGTGTTSGGKGGPIEDAAPWDKRIAEVNFSGNFGKVTLGNQWGILYEYLGWNVYRSDGNGGAAWYEGTRHISNDKYGLRVSNAFTYTYGGGGYSADPFTFSVQLFADPVQTATAEQALALQVPEGTILNGDETIDGVVIAAAATFGPVTINGVRYSESNSLPHESLEGIEPELTGVGFRWNVNDALYIGGTLMNIDRDDSDIPDDASAWNLIATYDFGGGISGIAGVGGGETGEADGVGDFSTTFLQVQKSFGQGVKIYAELESANRDLGAGVDDAEGRVFAVAVKNVF